MQQHKIHKMYYFFMYFMVFKTHKKLKRLKPWEKQSLCTETIRIKPQCTTVKQPKTSQELAVADDRGAGEH